MNSIEKDEIIIPGLFELLVEKITEMESEEQLSPISKLHSKHERLCKTCGVVISENKRLKTINISPDDKIQVLYFCCVDCFSKFNEFNYI